MDEMCFSESGSAVDDVGVKSCIIDFFGDGFGDVGGELVAFTYDEVIEGVLSVDVAFEECLFDEFVVIYGWVFESGVLNFCGFGVSSFDDYDFVE